MHETEKGGRRGGCRVGAKKVGSSPDYVSQHGQLVEPEQYPDSPVLGDDILLRLVVEEREQEACHSSSRTVRSSEAAGRTLPLFVRALPLSRSRKTPPSERCRKPARDTTERERERE